MRSLAWLGVSVLLAIAARADAARVTWTTEGIISGAPAEASSLGIVNGTPYTYRATYESTTPGVIDGAVARFADAVLEVSFVSGSYQMALAPGSTANIVAAGGSQFTVGGPVSLWMVDSGFFSDQLPIYPPLPEGSIRIELPQPLGFFFVGTSAIQVSVPEPGIAWLALIGAGCLRRSVRQSIA